MECLPRGFRSQSFAHPFTVVGWPTGLAFGLLPELDHLAVLLGLALLFLEVGLADDAHGDDEANGGQDDVVAFDLHGWLLGFDAFIVPHSPTKLQNYFVGVSTILCMLDAIFVLLQCMQRKHRIPYQITQDVLSDHQSVFEP